MNELVPMGGPSAGTVARSFWDRREGTAGKVVLGTLAIGAGAAAFTFWGIISSLVVHSTESLLDEVLLVGGLAVITSPIWDKNVRRMVNLSYQQTIRWGYGMFVQLDPIGIIMTTVQEMKQQGVIFAKAVESLSKAREGILNDLEVQKKGIQENKKLSDATGRQITQLQAQLAGKSPRDQEPIKLQIQELSLRRQDYAQDAGFQLETIKTEKPMLDTADTLYGQLSRLQTLADFKVMSLTKRADRLKKRRAMVQATGSALRSAASILKGDPTQMELVEQAIDYLDTEATDTLGAMKDFSRWANTSLIDMDIRNDAAAQDAMKMFSAMEQKLALPEGEHITVSDVASAMPDLDSPEIQKLLK